MTLKEAFARRFDHLTDDERAAKAAKLREILGRVRGAEHGMVNAAQRAHYAAIGRAHPRNI